MKTVFIKINNVSEINTAKISVRDLNNRYIDKEGRMYGLKYNRKSRKVVITRIIRTPAKSADYFNQILRTQRKEEKLSNNFNPVEAAEEGDSQFFKKEKESDEFDLNQFITKCVDLMQTHKGRISGIMMNIKNSRMIPEKDKIDYSQLNDLFRNLEIDGIIRIDKALSDYKELKNYPRSLTFYLSKLDSKNRRLVDELDSDSRKMAFIYAAETYYSIKILYRTLLKILNDLSHFINRISPGGPRDITSNERQYFIDAKVSVENTIEEITDIIEELKDYEDYLNNSKNF